jgi:hypothetical protein
MRKVMRQVRKLLLIATLWPLFAAAQATVQGTVVLQGTGSFGGSFSAASGIMGLTDWNETFAESTTVINAMQFTYSQFQQKTSLQNPAADACAGLYGGKFYLVGGYGTNATTYLDYVQIYNPVTNTWTQGATKTTAEWGAGCAVFGSKIYFFGGATAATGESGTTIAEVYDTAGNSWAALTALPTACADGVLAVTVGNFIYIEWNGNFWQFDPSASGGAGSYTALATPPTDAQVEWAATGYVNVSGDDRIYYLGGSIHGPPNYTNTAFYYSVTNATWSSALATAPYTAHGELQGAVYNGSVYYLAGFDGTVFYNTLYAYTPATGTWSSAIAAMNAFRDGVGGGFLGNVLYVIGGRNANAPEAFGMAVNESYQVGSTSVAEAFTKIQLHYTQTSPTGNVQLGVYADAGTSGPGSLILDGGSAAIASGWTTISGLNLMLTPGTRYWLAFVQSSSEGVDFTEGRPFNPASGVWSHCFATGTYGALPSTFPSAGLNCTGDNSMYAEQLSVN